MVQLPRFINASGQVLKKTVTIRKIQIWLRAAMIMILSVLRTDEILARISVDTDRVEDDKTFCGSV